MAETLHASLLDQVQVPPKSSKVAQFLERVREVEQLQNRVGGIVPAIWAAGALGISSERVSQMVEEGRLEVVTLHKARFVTMRSLIEFGQLERKTGRPPKKASVVEIAKASWQSGKEWKAMAKRKKS